MMKKLIVICFVALVGWLMTADANAYPTYHIDKDQILYGTLNQNDVPDFGPVACGPTAVTNSFVYLENKYAGIYNNSLTPAQGIDWNSDGLINDYDDMIATAYTLGSANYMNTINDGTTWHDSLIWGKWQYIEDRVPGMTVYEAQDYWPWARHTQPDWVTSMTPSWEFMYNELVDCEDVELLLTAADAGHYITLTGFHWDDLNNDGIINTEENALINYIDPWYGALGTMNIWQSELNGEIFTGYWDSENWISVAVSESVIPAPGAILLGGIGLGFVSWLRRRRTL